MFHTTRRIRFEEVLANRYLERLLATPQGRAHVLAELADAEANGEGAIFDQILSQVDDPELQRMIKRHAADEVMHARMFRDCIPRTGLPVPTVPDELKMIHKLNVAANGFLERPVASKQDVMAAYTMLQVIEERAIAQFAIFERAFRKVDPQTADVIARIAEDEERHLKYCHAISKKYAPDEATQARTLEEYRAIEERVFAENGRANMKYALDNDYLAIGVWEKLFWRAMLRLGEHPPACGSTRGRKVPLATHVAVA